jgi:hypothetical protein
MILVYPLEKWPQFAPGPAAALIAALPSEKERARFIDNTIYPVANYLARRGIPGDARRRACAAYAAALRDAAAAPGAAPADHRANLSLMVRALLFIYGQSHPLQVREIVEPLRPFAPAAAALGLVRAMRRKKNRRGPPPLELIIAEAEQAAQAQARRRGAGNRGAGT